METNEEMIPLSEAESRYGITRDGIYYHVRKGKLSTYKRAGDKRAFVKVTDMDALTQFKPSSETRLPKTTALPAI